MSIGVASGELGRKEARVSIEGFIEFKGFKTWYQIEGPLDRQADQLPLVVLHGGPGLPHDYLTPLARLAESGRQVIFYDQLGCGKSDRPEDDALWTMATFEDELDHVIRQLALTRFHLFGHSWGGWLALQFILDRQPQALVSLVAASTCASLPAFAATTRALKQQLPQAIQRVLDHHEAAGTTDDPAYFEASMAYITQWLIRSEIPDYVFAAKAGENERVSAIMQGPEWNVTGRLKDWDITGRLCEIRVPTLVTSGRFDEMTPDVVRPLVEGLPNAQWVVFEQSAHMAHVEESEAYLAAVAAHLERCERMSVVQS